MFLKFGTVTLMNLVLIQIKVILCFGGNLRFTRIFKILKKLMF